MSPVSLARHDGVSVITIDHPPVNALSRDVRKGIVDSLAAALDDAATGAIVLICEGRTFIAGADIKEFDKPPEPPHLPEVVERLEDARKPVLAALHGTALGGGLEIAMGCHYRLASATARLGLPEVKLGLLPGAGGTQRLPRLVGVERALDMMLSGEMIDAATALDCGLVDRITADPDLLGGALEYARECAARGPRRSRDLDWPEVDPGVFERARERLAQKARGLLSPERIVRAVELAPSGDFESGQRREREFFLECRESPQARGLRHAFFAERSAARVDGIDRDTEARPVESVGVIGAGTMGAGIAYNALSRGYAVQLVDTNAEALQRGTQTVQKLFDGGIERGKVSREEAGAALARLSSGQVIGDVAKADLVVEAVVEDMQIKLDVFRELDRRCKPGAVLATNTSTLNIDTIASATTRPGDVLGLHFFSPAHLMRLLEIVRGRETSAGTIATSLRFARQLGKIGVVVGNCPGFVGNRMLYCYGRENQLLLLEGAAPEYIDRVLTDWGMAMGPNAVGDLSGLDVGYKGRRARDDLPDDPRYYRVADVLVERGRLGRKTGAGVYRYADGRTPEPDPEVTEIIRAEAERLRVPQREIGEREIVERCIYALVVEGTRILEEGIAQRASDIDVVWLNGYGFPRHRGGPMHYADTVGPRRVLEAVMDFRERFGPLYWEPPRLLQELAASGSRFADAG